MAPTNTTAVSDIFMAISQPPLGAVQMVHDFVSENLTLLHLLVTIITLDRRPS